MNKHKIAGKGSEKLLFGSMAAAALGLINAKPKAVKADSINKSRATLNKANKRVAKTKLNYQTAVNVKTADTTEDDQKVEIDQGIDNEAESGNNNQSSVTTQDNNTNTTQDSNVETRTYKSDSASNKFVSDEAKRDDANIIHASWNNSNSTASPFNIPLTFHSDTGLMEIGEKDADYEISSTGNGDVGLNSFHISGMNFGPNIVKKININGTIKFTGSAEKLFQNLANLTEITGLENLNIENVTSMESMFENCASIKSIDLSASSADNLGADDNGKYCLRNMFAGCTSLTDLNIASISASDDVDDGSPVDMFKGDTNLRRITFGDGTIGLYNTALSTQGTWVNMGTSSYSPHKKGDLKYTTSAEFMNKFSGFYGDTYICFKNLGQPITISYQNDSKQNISTPDPESDLRYGDIDQSLINTGLITAFQPKEIDGYKFSKALNADTGEEIKPEEIKFTNRPQNVTFVYTSDTNSGSGSSSGSGSGSSSGSESSGGSSSGSSSGSESSSGSGSGSSSSSESSSGNSSGSSSGSESSSGSGSGSSSGSESSSGSGSGSSSGSESSSGSGSGSSSGSESSSSNSSNGSNASNTTGSIVNSPAAIAPAVTVHYQDEYGNTIAPDRVIQGRIGDGYTTGAETVSGYTLKTRPDNATGFFISSPQSVTYVYSKNDGQTNNSTPAPAGSQTPTDNEPTPIPSSKKAKKKKAPKKASKGLHANKQSKKGKKAPAKSIKGLTANKHQANHPAKLAAAGRKLNKVADSQKGKLDKGSRTDALPQTGAEKHNSLAMLAIGGLALATALGAAWLERKKD